MIKYIHKITGVVHEITVNGLVAYTKCSDGLDYETAILDDGSFEDENLRDYLVRAD